MHAVVYSKEEKRTYSSLAPQDQRLKELLQYDIAGHRQIERTRDFSRFVITKVPAAYPLVSLFGPWVCTVPGTVG
jgi:hypothetical protein